MDSFNKNASPKIRSKIDLIRGDVEVITKSIRSLDNVFNCVWHVKKCIPQMTNNDQAEFWNNIVISTLNSILIQETKTRQTIRLCFSIICDVTQNTLKLPQVLRAEKVKFAQKRIPNAFCKLTDNIKILETLEMVAINQMEKVTEKIFNLPGAGALTVLDQIKLVEAQLRKSIRRKNDILAECENKKVNMKILKPLIEHQQQLLRVKQLEIRELNFKLTKFQQTIMQLKLRIKITIRAKNYHRASYHQHVLKSKLHCLQKYTTQKSRNQNELKDLVATLCEYRAKYERDKAQLKDLGANSVTAIDLESKLAKLYEDVNKIENEKRLFEKHQELLGIEGDEYVKFLVNLRRLAIAIKLGCNSYAPIISVLNEIKVVIQCPIEMIESEEESDVILAEQLLLKNAESLWHFSYFVRLCMTNYHHKRGWLIERGNQGFGVKHCG
ncbi:uncharacterized protein LOC119072647 [Bradysia coprophila]|uniref:uncharacterized protein LOC119072647 n=1 Tax=Bradysia coprophila TaxID=38358 RepID=UPI00187D87CF|nr:uncharacterized protein LOC119072647 [Bradysia coprophila]